MTLMTVHKDVEVGVRHSSRSAPFLCRAINGCISEASLELESDCKGNFWNINFNIANPVNNILVMALITY